MEAHRLAASPAFDIVFPVALMFPVVAVMTLVAGDIPPFFSRLAGLKSNASCGVSALATWIYCPLFSPTPSTSSSNSSSAWGCE